MRIALAMILLGAPWLPIHGADEPELLLKKHCGKCHGADKQKGGLRLDSRQAILDGGETAAAVVPGKPAESLLIESLGAESDNHMPPKSQLAEADIAVLRQWVADGAKWRPKVYARSLAPVLETGDLVAPPADGRPVLAVALRPGHRQLVAARGWQLFRLDWKEDGSLEETGSPAIEHRDAVHAIAWQPDGTRFASGSYRRVAIASADGSAEPELVIDGEPFLGRITALAFADEGKTLLVADSPPASRARVHLVDVAAGTVRQTIDAHADAILDLAVSPDGKRFATASADQLAKLWSLPDGKLERVLEGHTGYVLAAAFRPDGTQLATSGHDEVVKVWNLESGNELSAFGRGDIATRLHWSTDPAAEKKREAEKDEDKRAEINVDRILGVAEDGKPRLFREINYHEGEQRSVGAKETALTEAGSPLASLAVDGDTLAFVAGTEAGTVVAYDAAEKITGSWPAEKPEDAE